MYLASICTHRGNVREDVSSCANRRTAGVAVGPRDDSPRTSKLGYRQRLHVADRYIRS